MWFQDRQYSDSDDDFKKMCELVIRLNGEARPVYEWSLGRLLSWKYGLWNDRKQEPGFFDGAARLWFDWLGGLAGFAVSEDGDNRFFLLVDPAYAQLCPAMLDWLEANRPDKDGDIVVYAGASDARKRRHIELAGYVDEGGSEENFVYRVEDIRLPAPVLPKGGRIVTRADYPDFDKVIRFRFYSFNPGEELTDALLYAFRYANRNPLVDPALEVLLLDADDEPVSGAVGYVDYRNRSMEVEVVCTRADCRGRGYARTSIGECMRLGMERGVKMIHISGWNDETRKLYSSFGGCGSAAIRKYVKKGGITPGCRGEGEK